MILAPRLDPSKTLLGWFVRHGEITAGNKWDGWGSYDLTPEGILSAEKAGQWLSYERVGRVISSDVPRTIHTAEIIMQCVNACCPMLSTDPNIRPLMVGTKFQGKDKTPERLKEFEYYLQHPDIPLPDGESKNQFKDRIQVISVYLTTPYDSKPSILVCHNSVIKCFMGIDAVKEAVAPGGIVAVYMDEKGDLDFEVVLGAVEPEIGVS